MKIIKYQLMTEVDTGTENQPNVVQKFTPVVIRCTDSKFEAAYSAAEAEAYGEITVEEVPDPEPAPTPTQLDRVEAQIIYTAMITDTLLPEV